MMAHLVLLALQVLHPLVNLQPLISTQQALIFNRLAPAAFFTNASLMPIRPNINSKPNSFYNNINKILMVTNH